MKLIVFAQAAESTPPAERPLDHPASGQNLEPANVIRAANDLDAQRPQPSAQLAYPLDQFARVGSVGPKVAQTEECAGQWPKELTSSVTILHVGGMHDDAQQQTQRVDEQVSLATTDFLACVVTARPPSPWS